MLTLVFQSVNTLNISNCPGNLLNLSYITVSSLSCDCDDNCVTCFMNFPEKFLCLEFHTLKLKCLCKNTSGILEFSSG